MKKSFLNLNVIVLGVLIGLLLIPFIPSIPTYAESPPSAVIEEEFLSSGETRLSPFTTVQFQGTYTKEGVVYQRYRATVSTLPQTLSDLKTKITVEWRRGQSSDGVVYYDTGNNIYYARVTGTSITVQYRGFLSTWNPFLYLGDTKLNLVEGPRVTQDNYRETEYEANVIEWVYETPGGVFSKPFRILRYLRQVRGQLQEFYVLESNPGKSFRVDNNYKEEAGFVWSSNLYAHDSEGKSLVVTGNPTEKFVDLKEFNRPDIVYPVIIDPTYDSLYNKYYLQLSDSSYTTARTASSGLRMSGSYVAVGQQYSGGSFAIYRAPLYFPTEPLPDDAINIEGYIRLRGDLDHSDTNFYITVQTGGTYPNRPPDFDDYNYALYSGTGGSFSTLGYSTSGYNNIYLTSTGESWINLEGWTEFMLRSSRDIDGTVPSGDEYVDWRSSSYGSDEPQLVVTYDLPLTKPVVATYDAQDIGGTEAIGEGKLINDGGTYCDLRFDYGTTPSYGHWTQEEGGHDSGDYYSDYLPGLSYGTLYYYTLRADNGPYTSDDDPMTFLTEPNKPTSFTATGGEGKVDLAWTKGSGTLYTDVQRKTTGFPSSPTDGTQVYYDEGSAYEDTAVVNGTTYYYRAWSYQAAGGHEQYSSGYGQDSGMPYTTGVPGVTTYDTTPIGTTTATYQGHLDNLNGEADADVYFDWYWGAGAWADNAAAGEPSTLTGPGDFHYDASGLPAGTLIHVRARAVSNSGTGYGEDVPFTTGGVYAPDINTTSIIATSGTTGYAYGKVIDDGGDPGGVTVDFQYGLAPGEYGFHTVDQSGFSTGQIFEDTLDELDPDTTYYVRARGWNSAGLMGYGAELNVTTPAPSAPVVTTEAATDTGATVSLFHAFLDADGDVPCEVRFQWSLNATLSENVTSTEWQGNKWAGAYIEQWVYNLTIDVTHYFRAQAQNSGGSHNGTILSFDTIFAAPEDFIAIPLSSTSIGLTWDPQSDKTIIRVKVGAFPINYLDGNPVWSGPGNSITCDEIGGSPLVSGVTYFFRAWSWRAGENYSEAYAEDAATTLLEGAAGDLETPADAMNWTALDAEAPEYWWQGTGSSQLSSWAPVEFLSSQGAKAGMSDTAFWLWIGGFFAVIIGIAGAIWFPNRWTPFMLVVIFVGILVGGGVLVGWLLPVVFIGGIAINILMPSGA